MRPFQKCITQVHSLVITEVVGKRVTRCSGQFKPDFMGEIARVTGEILYRFF